MALGQCVGTLTVESIWGSDRSSYAVRAKAQALGINRMLRGDFHLS